MLALLHSLCERSFSSLCQPFWIRIFCRFSVEILGNIQCTVDMLVLLKLYVLGRLHWPTYLKLHLPLAAPLSSLDLFFTKELTTVRSIIHFTSLFLHYFLPCLWECKLHGGKDFSFFFCLFYSFILPCLEEHLAQSRCQKTLVDWVNVSRAAQ